MSKKPLYPHTPKKKEPLFPHAPRGTEPETQLPQTTEDGDEPKWQNDSRWLFKGDADFRAEKLRKQGLIVKVELQKAFNYPKGWIVYKAYPDLHPQTIVGGEPIPDKYRWLIPYIGNEPLPQEANLLLPAVEVAEGERKIDAVLRRLADGVESIQDSTQFRLYLTTMSKFHDYSISNMILIMIQKPNATHVAGFVTWKDLGRWVRAGEQGIAILAPIFPPRATCPKCGTKISKGTKYCPKCGEPVEVEEKVEVRYFKVVSVFDISQTDGKPLPEFEVPVLTGAVNEELFSKLLALMKAKNIPISFESQPHLDPGRKGQYSPATGIWVRPEEPRAQQLKSLAHEIAHYYSEGVFRIPRVDAETIAESAAYVVCAHYGFDTGVRSFPYVALWAKDKKVLEQNLGAIQKVATTILEGLT